MHSCSLFMVKKKKRPFVSTIFVFFKDDMDEGWADG